MLGLDGNHPMSGTERENLIRSSNWSTAVAAATGFNEQLAKLMQSKARADAKSLDEKSKGDSDSGLLLPPSKVCVDFRTIASIYRAIIISAFVCSRLAAVRARSN